MWMKKKLFICNITAKKKEKRTKMKVRKMLSVLVSSALIACSGSLVFAEETTEAEERTDLIARTASERLMGGWEAAEDPAVTEEIQALLDKATEGLLGATYEPIALLGTQVVAGTNYCILCKTTVVYPDAKPFYTLVYLYEDLEGSVETTAIVGLDIAELSAPATEEQAGEEETETEEAAEAAPGLGGALGGWQANEDYSISEDLAAVFEKATEGLLGVAYTPVADLAAQIVAGTNHCILSQAKIIYPDALPYYTLVYVYEDLEGGAHVTQIADLDIATLLEEALAEDTEEPEEDESEAEEPEIGINPLLGGWNTTEPCEITEDVQAVFDKATEKLLGAAYEPIAYLGRQVVAGTNHCILCRTTAVYPGALPYYTLVYIYEDLEGNAEITQICDLNIAEFSQPEIEE